MTSSRKVKVSVSLPAELVAQLDRRARALPRGSRSAAMEVLLRRGVRADEEAELRDAVVAYYTSLNAKERGEDVALGRALSRAAKRLAIDDGPDSEGSDPSP